MQRRKYLVGMGSLVAGGAAAISTSAFSSVEAERTLSVETAGDQGAYLVIDPSNTPYVSQTGETVEIQTDQLNENAKTEITNILRIENQGDRSVHFWIDAEGLIESLGADSSRSGNSDFDQGITHFSAYLSDPDANAGLIGRQGDPPEDTYGVVLPQGTDAELALVFDTRDLANDFSFSDTITFWAVSDNSEAYPDSGPSALGGSPSV